MGAAGLGLLLCVDPTNIQASRLASHRQPASGLLVLPSPSIFFALDCRVLVIHTESTLSHRLCLVAWKAPNSLSKLFGVQKQDMKIAIKFSKIKLMVLNVGFHTALVAQVINIIYQHQICWSTCLACLDPSCFHETP